jgi:hypothetical protein
MRVGRPGRLANNVNVYRAAEYLSHLLCTLRNDTAPRCAEAQRRITTFATSLHMRMPAPKFVRQMRSITTLTPFYNEDVLYTKEKLTEEPVSAIPAVSPRPSRMALGGWAETLMRGVGRGREGAPPGASTSRPCTRRSGRTCSSASGCRCTR